MESYSVEIRNCNNVKSARIQLVKSALNIKFGYNGIGKSTLAQAMEAKSYNDHEKFKHLMPYGADSSKAEEQPSVVGMDPFGKVKVFNEEYVSAYVFNQDRILEDSFRVFLRTTEIIDLEKDINEKLRNLQGILFKDRKIRDVLDMLASYIKSVGFNGRTIGRRGGIGEILNGRGIGFDQHPEIAAYKPFYKKEISHFINWADWRNKGIDHMEDYHCPFCAKDMDKSIDKENEVISRVFKKSALNKAKEIMDYLDDGVERGYIASGAMNRVLAYLNDNTKSIELESELNRLAAETDYFYKKMDTIVSFRPLNVRKEELDDIENTLTNMKIDKEQIASYYATDLINETIDSLNERIDLLLENTGALKGLFFKYDSKLKKNIQQSKDDINEFFSLAGFPYEFDIVTEAEEKANAYLRPAGKNEIKVDSPEKRLSWGERNAFALVMFMFEAISDKADFIVLDDPISSFDINKKFAVMRRIFDNKKPSFRNKTVMLLTHDLEPVIDCIRLKTFQYEVDTPVCACYIENVNGEIKEKKISTDDLKNTVGLTEKYAREKKESFCVRVVNLRKNLELTSENFAELPMYHILSSLIHGRPTPTDESEVPLNASDLKKGCKAVSEYLDSEDYEDYSDMLAQLEGSQLVSWAQGEDRYTAVVAVRLLLERHREWKRELRRQSPALLKFLNESNHIENDYIFQLDPHEFFFMPDNYHTEIRKFLHSKQLLED